MACPLFVKLSFIPLVSNRFVHITCQPFVIVTVPHPRLGRVEVPLTKDALPTRREVMTPPALRHRAVPPLLSPPSQHR